MVDLSTTYLGIPLENPLIVGSCGLVKSLDGVRRAADAGAGAVVLKSLFEEQIEAESEALNEAMKESAHTEALEYIRAEIGMQFGAGDYVKLIQMAKKAVSTPIIASINCISPKWWIRYAKQIAESGADALELNISRMPVEPDIPGSEVERIYYSIVEDVKKVVQIPVAVKIGPFFTSLAHLAKGLAEHGADGLVLFNRFYRPDIDIHHFLPTAAKPFSTPEEIHLSLRWIALLAGKIPCDLAASTGVHDAQGLVKQLLAGATAVQVCSTLYIHGFEQIEYMLEGLSSWMQKHGLNTLQEVRDKMGGKLATKPEMRERLQYIKIFGGVE